MSAPKECIIIGRTNVGKTLFLLNFAEYCGVEHAELRIRRPGGSTEEVVRLSIEAARSQLVGARRHQTRCLQSLELTLPKGMGRRRFRLTDTAGLTDSIHEAEDVRRAVAQTLRALRDAPLVIHMLDAAALGERGTVDSLPEVDLQISRYAPLRSAYLVVANKIDLPLGPAGLDLIRRALSQHRVIPTSAVERTGFREVKAFVWDHL